MYGVIRKFEDPHLVLSGLLVGRGKKSQISRDFRGQIRGNFAGIFEASFAEKRLVNADFVGASRANFAGKRLVLR